MMRTPDIKHPEVKYKIAYDLHLGFEELNIPFDERMKSVYKVKQATEIVKMRCKLNTKEDYELYKKIINISMILSTLEEIERRNYVASDFD